MVLAVLTGNEIVQVLGQDANGRPAASLEATTTQAIANLVGSGTSSGTFVATGTASVTVNNTAITITSNILISLNTVGGTVGAVPSIKTIAAGTFTVAATAADTSTYNYSIL